MILDRVTITGADDSISPLLLLDLSRRFPFAEWGILFGSEEGVPRFPSSGWVAELLNAREDPLRLSAHLCGRWVRDVLQGRGSPHIAEGSAFARVQLNFRQYQQIGAMPGLLKLLRQPPPQQLILQCDGVNDPLVRKFADAAGHFVPLFDTSGGAGVVPDDWPDAWPGMYCGYAGGLGPENVLAEVEVINSKIPVDARIWIDMERRVRSDDDTQFDIAKVEAVLQATAALIN